MPTRTGNGQPLRIGVDAHVIGSGKGGAETYSLSLLGALLELDTEHEIVALLSPKGAEATESLAGAGLERRYVSAENLVWQRFVALGREARKARVDVLHTQRVIPMADSFGRVVTVHDLAQFDRPDLYGRFRGMALRRLISASIARADHVITDAQYSRKDIASRFSRDIEDITAIPLGIDHIDTSANAAGQKIRSAGISHAYVLAVGALEWRKNYPALLEAYARLRETVPDAPSLVIVGGNRSADVDTHLEALADSLGIREHVHLLGYVGDELLAALYSEATAFACPSLIEGFSLPPLEALMWGVPAMVSDIPVHREVLADAAEFVSPDEIGSIAEGLRRIVTDDSLRATLSQKGRERAGEFSWRETARATLHVYEKAAARRASAEQGRGRG